MVKLYRFLLGVSVIFLLSVYSSASYGTDIGVIFSADIPQYRKIHATVMDELKRLGVDTGKLHIMEQKPYPDVVSWGNASRKLIAYDVDMIIAYGAGAAVEAVSETSSIPVVYASVYNDIRRLRKKNVAGCSYRVSMSSFLRYLRKARDVHSIGVLYSPFEIDSRSQLEALRVLGKDLGMQVVPLAARNAREMETQLKLKEFDALFVTGSALANHEIELIHRICMKRKIPVLSLFEGTEEYAFLTIAPDVEIIGKETARIVKGLLDEGRFGGTRHRLVTKTKVYFNLRLTNRLGLRIPVRLVTSADRVIR